jgi:nucleoid-associated protein YgaU
MPIFRGSRYEGVEYTGVRDHAGNVRRTLHDRRPLAPDALRDGAVVHTVQAGEELDLLAFRYGGKARLWWLIADVNGIDFPFDIEPGTRLLIPDGRIFQEAG